MDAADKVKKTRSRLIVSKGSESFALKTEDVAYIFRNNLIVIVVDRNGTRYLYDKSLSELEAALDPRQFFRANRKYIINIDFVKSYKTIDRVKLEVHLNLVTNGYQIIISQENSPHFKKWLQDEE